jgi:hypothetical protein
MKILLRFLLISAIYFSIKCSLEHISLALPTFLWNTPCSPLWNHNSPFPPLILRGGAAGGGVIPKRGEGRFWRLQITPS